MVDKGFAWFENMAWRMVDAQAGGLATMVRNLGGTNFYAESWQSRFMTQLLSIYVVIEGYKNNKSLDNLLQQDIRSLIGFTQNQDELKEQSGISDNWLALCKQNLDIDHITTERNWLCGIETKRYALVLQFIVNGQGRQFTLTSGLVIRAELVFFPSVSPLRAIIKTQTAST